MPVVDDMHVLQFSDDVRNAVRTLLNLLAPRLAACLPVRAPRPPETLNVMGSGFGSVVMHTRPRWEGASRVVVDGDLITIDARDSEGRWGEIWRSDLPNVVSTPRQELRDEERRG
jgi:hypothetical protein